MSDKAQQHNFGGKMQEIFQTTYFKTMSKNKLREKLFMTWDLSAGQNISKKILKKELSYKISTKGL